MAEIDARTRFAYWPLDNFAVLRRDEQGAFRASVQASRV